MPRKACSVAEIQATLPERIREVERGGPILITRDGKGVAALVTPEDLEQVERLRAAGATGGLAGLVGGWEGSEELADLIDSSRRIGSREAGGPG